MLIDIKGGYKTHVYTCMYYIYVYNMSCTRTCTRTPNLSSNDYNGVLLFRNVYVDFLQHDIPTGWYVICFLWPGDNGRVLDTPSRRPECTRIDKLGREGIRTGAKEVRPPATHQRPLFELKGECDFNRVPNKHQE